MKSNLYNFYLKTFCVIFLGLFFLGLGISKLGAEDDIERAGDILRIGLPLGAYGLALYYKDRDGCGQLTKSLITSCSLTYILKWAIDEKRPNGGKNSFPSGHSAIAFSAASYIQRRYGWSWGLGSYLLASFIAWSRLEAHEHYLGDVVAGAWIGCFSSLIFTQKYPSSNFFYSISPQGFYFRFLKSF